MSVENVDGVIENVVMANRILAREGVLDVFGHVSARHPDRQDWFLLSRSLSPSLVEPGDIMTFDSDGNIVEGDGAPYLERMIHAAVYKARPDVNSVVHHHSQSMLPFALVDEPLVPVFHLGAMGGERVPVWDSRDEFGDTSLLVSDMPMAVSMARVLAGNPGVLLKRHGVVCVASSVRQLVFVAIQMRDNAELVLRTRVLGQPDTLSPGEIALAAAKHDGTRPVERAWEFWCARATAQRAGS